MKKISCLLLFIFYTLLTVAQQPNEFLTKQYKKFIPKGYTIIDTSVSDFNNDKIDDIVIVATDEKDPDKDRAVIILNNKKEPTFSAISINAILCKGCGGVFGDPYTGIHLNKNILTINNYGGSAWRWGNEYTFRFQNKHWELIGLRSISYWVMADCPDGDAGAGAYNLIEVNFSTKKIHTIKTKDDACKPYFSKWTTFKSYNKVFLENFNVNKDYFPKIE